MKKIFAQFLILLSIALVVFSCKKSDDDSVTGWADEDKASYQQVINVQDEIGDQLDDWFQSMDSLEAINQAYQAFLSNEDVSSATINSQGIAVQYTNGIRGGLFLNPRDEDLDTKSQLIANPLGDENSSNLKSLVNQRKMILINPHYYQRSSLTDQIYTISRSNLQRAGIDLATFYKNEEATVDRFTELSGYGIIQIYSHGWAWPKQENITDIYLLTGETANEATSKKYWDDLKVGNIPIMKIGPHNKYFISQEFVSNYNDFSNDTVMFYGGFCYSFLGGWPDIIDNFADGAYMGFDWSVLTFFNANMSVNSMALMSDTSKTSPMNLEAWMNDPGVEKSFWHSLDNRTVYIHYAGDGNLKLWDDVSVRLIPLSPDGAPVSVPGEAGITYPFRCEVVTDYDLLEYVWDIGDGSSPVTASNEVNITWSNDGNYVLKVDVIDQFDGSVFGSATLNVTIGEMEIGIVAFMKTCNYVYVEFDPGSTLINYPYSDINWIIEDLSWDGLNFSGTTTGVNGLWVKSIEGTLSGDGQKISFTANKEGTDIGSDRQVKVMMQVVDYPLHTFIPESYAYYEVDPPGEVSYVTDFSAEIIEDDYTYYITMADFDWTKIDDLVVRFYPTEDSPSSVKVDE